MSMAMGLHNQRKSRRRFSGGFNEINVTPFVDVMLVLLVIFMITAPMLTSGVTVDLPKTKSTALPGNDQPVAVTIRLDGSIYIQNTEVELSELGSKLEAILGEKKETRIFIRGDRAIDYGRVMQVVSAINGSGFTRVALLTDTSGAPNKN